MWCEVSAARVPYAETHTVEAGAATSSRGEAMKLTSQDESDIRGILDDYIGLWMDGQAQACADLYEESGDALAVDGKFLRGRDEIKQYYDEVMSGKYSGLEVRHLRNLGIRALGEGVAIMDATWEVHAPSDDASSSTTVGRPICSLVVVRTEDGWKITAARLMEPMTPETLATRQDG